MPINTLLGINFAFSSRGLLECPEDYYQVEFSSTCAKVCPPDAPLNFRNLCQTFCPYGYEYSQDSRDTTTCSNWTELSEFNSSNRCQVNSCPSVKPLCYGKKCLSDCPNGTITEEGNCSFNCSNDSRFILDDSCVSICPTEKPYDEYGHCVSACSPEYFMYKRKCMKSCPRQTHHYNNTCVETCPTEASKSLQAWNITFCVTSCPSFTSVNESQCEVECPIGKDYLWNNSCVNKCPELSPLVYVLTRRVPPYKIPICTPKCPPEFYLQGNHCVPNCTFSQYHMNFTCVSECSLSHPYFTGTVPPFQCVRDCEIDQMRYENHCVNKCPTDQFIFNKTCVDDCPVTHNYKVNQTCLSRCPPSMVLYNGSCLLTCPADAVYLYEGQCHSECPVTHPSHHHAENGVVVCQPTSHCPKGEFSWNNNCFYQCPDYTVFINSTCLTQCPLSHQFKYRSDNHRSLLSFECVAECPENTFMKEEYCYDHCDSSLVGFSGNHTCLERCPDSDHWRSVTKTITNQLAFTCASNCSSPRLIYEDQCLLTCPNSKPFTVNQTCSEKCPNNASLILPFENGMKCLKTCPDTHIQDDDTCVLKCSPGKVIIDNTCVDVKFCVNEYQFIEYSQHGTICRKRCLDNQFVDNIRCVTSCPQFSVGKYCVAKCPSFQKFTRVHNSTDEHAAKICYEECPRKTYANGTKCIDIDCPMKYLGDTRKCVSACTVSHPYLQDIDMCVNKCSNGYVITTDNRCIQQQQCLEEAGFFVYGGQCINSCPAGTYANYFNNSCILSSVVYLMILASVICTILVTAGAVWLYYYRKKKYCKNCFSKTQEHCVGDTPLLTEDVLSEGYALTDLANDPPSKTDVVS
ncbi:proprotein convertase subtilisin/kexin type 5-like [Ylistrum balloti]|uniref:proprotein convertase subtilisin/kexin type 5-like n=1 Tax=Ylistrum balloti TaxID=509963 RepID=UPI002905C452|nr:proprotein convertase subtilisin/kexin type 5-like [Ylistrum balloti]